MADTKQHIGVFRLSAMGDVAMIVPVLRAFSKQHPFVKITVISRAFFKAFFEDIPQVHFFIFDDEGRHKGFLGLLRLFWDIKKMQITAFADVHNVLRSKIVGFLLSFCGIKVVILNKDRAAKKALTRVINKQFFPLTTVFEKQCEVYKKLGFMVNLSQPIFPEKKALPPEITTLIGMNYQYLIGIAPFAQYQSKVYPLDLMAQVIDKLAATKNTTLLLFGGGNTEITILNNLSQKHQNVIVVAGKLKMQQELQLMAHLNLLISMDSGNAHLAAMQGTKVLSLWGGTHPYAGFAPFNQKPEDSLLANRNLYPHLPNSIYGNKTIAGYEDAMRSILPETIVAKVHEMLG